MEFKTKKGDHSSTPFSPKIWTRSVEGSLMIPTSSIYEIEGPDQLDWNKACGIGFNPIKPNDHAIMIGWRYNAIKKLFEVAPYFNISGRIINPDNDKSKVIQVIPYEKVSFRINYDVVMLEESGVYRNYKVPTDLKRRYWSSFRIQPWFGGNQPAPKDISIFINFK